MFNSAAIISPQRTVFRMRLLPHEGRVYVDKGQQVEAGEVIAETQKSSRHFLVDIARGLGIKKEQVNQYLHCRVGEVVQKGDLIAGPHGRTRRKVRSPYSGKVVHIENSEVLLEVAREIYRLNAGYSGEIVKVFPGFGAVVKAQGSLIQGVWGNGKMSDGKFFSVNTFDELKEYRTNNQKELQDLIVVMEVCNDGQIFKLSSENWLKGLICSSIKPELLPLASEVSYPVIIIDGFNNRLLNPLAKAIIGKSSGCIVSINAQPWNRSSGSRPEIFISKNKIDSQLFFSENVAREIQGFHVRIVSGEQSGKTGLFIRHIGEHNFKNGIRAKAAEVILEGNQSEFFPVSNLELIDIQVS